MSRDDLLKGGAAAAWKLLAFIAGIVVAVVYLGDLDARRARSAAQEVAMPIESRLDRHLAAVEEAKIRMEKFADRTERNLAALCRASHADCQ